MSEGIAISISPFKTFSSGETLTASDLNSSFSQITDNGEDLGWPATKAKDLNGNSIVLDSDADSTITADTDDRIDFAVGGNDALLLGHASGNTGAFLLLDPGAFTATANTDIGRARIGNSAAMTIPTGTTAIAAGLFVEEPNLTATGTITSAVTVYIQAAPDEGGTNNYALWVDAGATQLDGTLDVGGATTLASTLSVTGAVDIASDLVHTGDTNNKISFGTDTQSFETGGTSRLDLTDSGVRMGAANARVTTVLDEDAMGSDSATSLATQQSIKAYVDTTAQASQAEAEAESNVNKYIPPDLLKHSPGVAKVWGQVADGGTAALQGTGHGIDSIDDDATGDYGVNYTTAFSDATYSFVATAINAAGNRTMCVSSLATGAGEVLTFVADSGAQANQGFCCAAYGDQ